MRFPTYRARRLREHDVLRQMVQETRLAPQDFIYPLFVTPGRGVREEISSMPGNYHLSVDQVEEEVREAADLGIPAVLLFGLPEGKDAVGSEAYSPSGVIQQASQAIKKAAPSLMVVTDVCLCEYTDHGHCGVIEGDRIVNDLTLDLLCRAALSHVEAGADMVAPSDMMDGRVGAIRETLDAKGHVSVPIMAYAAKYASSFYGPFREAADSTPQFGDRRSYQMNPANAREALREVRLDIEEGADIVMVKPALAYLDVICQVRQMTDLPVAAYNVSGEFAMIKAAARLGWLDEMPAMLEALIGIKRAGADIIMTYSAKEVVPHL
ncbi:MAG: delta-aminolevulinic acid dehydratase [Candidatus Entotheonella gemina]|uniref:Delta-aminolevulinic acid dehydratase n=1 Tax=Candidatus Entotheonella gemina TaxID=1429439 RepID=W4M6J0_9BACT|nr:MAG: delta-aminolevulinic acid dehydratase [Candidatus Entotheonella gemina]